MKNTNFYTAILHFNALKVTLSDSNKTRLERLARWNLKKDGNPPFPYSIRAHSESAPVRYEILNSAGHCVEKLPCVLRRDAYGRKYWSEN